MALNGSFYTSVASGHYKLQVDWTAAQSVANNTSTITVKAYLVNDWDLSVGARSNNAISVNGVSDTYNTSAIRTTGTHLLTTYTSDPIVHNADGSKSINITVKWKMNATINGTYYGTMTASATVTLDTIARASQPSLITYPNTTSDVGYFGDTISIHMNRNSSAFTHKVRYAFGPLGGTCIDADTGKEATAVGTGFRWKIPTEFMDKLTGGTVGSGTIYADTYNGSTLIGTKYTGFTAKVPDSVKPTCTIQVLDNTNIQATYGSLVKGLSKLYVKTNFYAAHSSPVKAYNVTANGVRYTENEIVTDVLTNAGTTTITATVTDQRNRTSEPATASFPVLDYSLPSITKLTAVRSNQNGTANKRGGFVKVTLSAVVTDLNSKNQATYSIQYKKTSEASWTSLKTDANGKAVSSLKNNFKPTDITFVFAANVGNSYDVMLSVVDNHNASNPTTRSAKAPTATSVFSWRGFKNASGVVEDGAGIGKVPEKPNTLQVGWNAEFEEEVYYKGKTLLDYFYPVNSIYISYSHTNPSTLFGGTWERISNQFLWAADASGTIGQTGGEKTHTLTVDELPAHSHGSVYSQHAGPGQSKNYAWYTTTGTNMGYGPVETGGGQAHNNMPPYIQVSVWRRTG